MNDLPERNFTTRSSAMFVSGGAGRLFCISTAPDKSEFSSSQIVLIVPPFAEELNRSRRFLTLLRKKISSAGSTVVLADLFGTGDSEGEFAHASVDIWLDDLTRIAELHSPDEGGTLSLLGIRSGCLLVEQLLRDSAYAQIIKYVSNIVYVQPEISGYDVVQRMLRTRVAARRFAGDKSETAEMLWSRLENGDAVYTSGYHIGSSLALTMRPLVIEPQALPPVKSAKWLSLVENDEIPCINSSWHAQQTLSRPFWQLHDNEPEPHLINRFARFVLKDSSESNKQQ